MQLINPDNSINTIKIPSHLSFLLKLNLTFPQVILYIQLNIAIPIPRKLYISLGIIIEYIINSNSSIIPNPIKIVLNIIGIISQ